MGMHDSRTMVPLIKGKYHQTATTQQQQMTIQSNSITRGTKRMHKVYQTGATRGLGKSKECSTACQSQNARFASQRKEHKSSSCTIPPFKRVSECKHASSLETKRNKSAVYARCQRTSRAALTVVPYGDKSMCQHKGYFISSKKPFSFYIVRLCIYSAYYCFQVS